MAQECTVTPGCTGHIVDGFCDVCGMQPVGSPADRPSDLHRTDSHRTDSTQLSGAASRVSKRSSKATKVSSSRRLGLGLVTLPEVLKTDPLKNLMAEAKVPESKRFCTGVKSDGSPCETPLTREKCTKCGHTHEYKGSPRESCVKCGGRCEIIAREKGFCNVCGTPYDFRPKLKPGYRLAGQYEVAGCLAFGGMGWIYLARDITLNRYVVIKGLVNSSDPNLAKAAVAERQFLAEVKHPNIVDVYTCISDTSTIDNKTETQAYTVMEYVGGVTLKALRKERGPLPPAEVLAYMHPVLQAFGYMHASGLLYNDFKPDNVMLEEGDIKIIDLGGVCRMTQAEGDVYSTVGYSAPELGSAGPSVTSDLYSIGRTVAVLISEFAGFQSSFRHRLRTPLEVPIFEKYESLYRFLQKACHEDPNLRFQNAEEMAEQLVGILREIVAAETGEPRRAESRLFGPDTLSLRPLDGAQGIDALDLTSLPVLKMIPDDPGGALILSNIGTLSSMDMAGQAPLLLQAIAQFPQSVEALLAMANNQVRTGNYVEAEKYLVKVEEIDPFDWRVIWYRGLAFIAQKSPADALRAFATCYAEVPGELAVKLAIAVAAELAGDIGCAVKYYDCVSKTDPSYATAIFGLGRCLAFLGKREEAIAALARVSHSSSLYSEAQKEIAGALILERPASPGPAELARASATIDALMLDSVERFRLACGVFETARKLLATGKVTPAPEVKLFGRSLDPRSVGFGLEHAYRNLAKLIDDVDEKIRLVDLANSVRPTTFV